MRGGAVLIYSFHCVNLFNWFHFGQMWLSVKSLHSSGWGSKELKCEHKRSPFCDSELNFSTFSSYDKVHNWRWCNMRALACLRSAKCLSRVHCAWNCWGWGLIWVRGLSARASHSYGGAGASPRHPRGWAVKARYEKPLRCAKFTNTNVNTNTKPQKYK